MKLGLVVMLAACGGGHDGPVHDAPVSSTDATADANGGACPFVPRGGGCSVLTQAGCPSGDKCTWVLSTDPVGTAPGLGSVDCVPDGVVPIGGACTILPAGMCGYDNCVKGSVCFHGTCNAICDPKGAAPTCDPSVSCVTENGLFANEGATTTPGGVCGPTCDPLDDNDFDGPGTVHTKTGTACGTDPLVGCVPHLSSAPSLSFDCEPTGTVASGESTAGPPPGKCMSGYVQAFAIGATGTMTASCFAMCKPGDAYLGNPNAQQPNGVSPHGCNTTDATGTFGAIPNGGADSNGEHCMYSWFFEEDTAGHVHHSRTSDTVGFCWDHSKYKYASTSGGTPDTVIPPCAALPLHSTTAISAIDFGCVSTALGGLDIPAHRPYIEGLPVLRHR